MKNRLLDVIIVVLAAILVCVVVFFMFDRETRVQAVVTPSVETIDLVTSTATITPAPTSMITPMPSATATEKVPDQAIAIGYSVEGRPLEVYQFGRGEHRLMIVAGIHGGYEWNTVSLANELIQTMQDGEIVIPEDVTLYVLPNLNPDGYAKQLGVEGRANANGVDLNRNWDADWRENWYGTQCWSYRYLTAGSEPFSEPETRALSSFLLENQVEALISYHSAGLGIFPGGWWDDRRSLNLAAQLALVSTYQYPPYDSDCEYTGQMIDWAAMNGIAGVDIELTNHTDTDLEMNKNILKAFLNYQTYIIE